MNESNQNPLGINTPERGAIENRNRQAYDRMVQSKHFLTQPVSPEELANPLATLDAKGWLGGNIRNWNVLCLAAGGGRQGPLYRAAGAHVTVLDISPAMLELDRQVSGHLGLNYQIVQGDMADLSMFANDAFDLVAHPVSTCYVPNLEPVLAEVARVLRPGGLYVSQHKQPMNLQASLELVHGKYVVETPVGQPAKPLSLGRSSLLREPETIEFAHSLDAILGGICRAGMNIEAVSEPDHANRQSEPGSMGHRSCYIRPYLRIKARKHPNTENIRKILLG
jgi:SAM-dependent methyltransferase